MRLDVCVCKLSLMLRSWGVIVCLFWVRWICCWIVCLMLSFYCLRSKSKFKKLGFLSVFFRLYVMVGIIWFGCWMCCVWFCLMILVCRLWICWLRVLMSRLSRCSKMRSVSMLVSVS